MAAVASDSHYDVDVLCLFDNELINIINRLDKLETKVNEQHNNTDNKCNKPTCNRPLRSIDADTITMSNGEYIWEIQNYVQLNMPLAYTSPHLYTSEYGYKICFRLFPCGKYNGSGTHVSIYVCVTHYE